MYSFASTSCLSPNSSKRGQLSELSHLCQAILYPIESREGQLVDVFICYKMGPNLMHSVTIFDMKQYPEMLQLYKLGLRASKS